MNPNPQRQSRFPLIPFSSLTHSKACVHRLGSLQNKVEKLTGRGRVLGAVLLIQAFAWVSVQAAPPIMTSVFSPQSTVKLEGPGGVSSIRHTVPLPNQPFTITTGSGDLVQVQLHDGSFVRLAPDSTVKFAPMLNRVTVSKGTALIYFSENASLHVADLKVRGSKSMVMVTSDANESRVLPLSGSVSFLGQRIQEGHIAVAPANGRVNDIGPTDLNRFENECALLIDLPGSPSLAEQMAPPSVGLRAGIDTLNARSAQQAAATIPDLTKAAFFGSSMAQAEGSSARISDMVAKQAPFSVGTPENPSISFQQLVQNRIVANPVLPPAVPPFTIVVPPPALGGLTLAAAGWSVNAAGAITDGVGFLVPFSTTGGILRYTTTSFSDGANAFTGSAFVGAKELNFTANSAVAGNAFSFTGALPLGTLSFTLTSTSSTADITLGGAALTTTGSVTLSSQRDIISGRAITVGGAASNGAAGTAVAAATAGGAGGNVSMTSGATAGNISVTAAISTTGGTGGAGGAVGVGLANPSGAGGAGGAITLTASQGTITGGSALTSTGGVGGAATGGGLGGGDPFAAKAAALAAGAAGSGGAGGAINIQAGGVVGGVSTTLGTVASTGGAAGALPGIGVSTFGKTGVGGAGGNMTVGSSPGTVTFTSLVSTGGAGDGSTTLKLGTGDGGNGGTVAISTTSTSLITATSGAVPGIQSVGGISASHTDVSQTVPKGGLGGNITVNVGSIANGTRFTSLGGNGGLTDGTLAAPSPNNEKAGMGGDGGAISVTVTGAPDYAPNLVSQGGDAGNTAFTHGTKVGAITSPLGPFSRVFNGVGGKGGDLTITRTSALGSLDLKDTGGANIASIGGSEVTSGALGGSTSNGVNVNGNVSVSVNNNLVISSATAFASSGNGTASGFDRNANGGLGQSTTVNSGILTITSKDLAITDGLAGGVGVVNGGGSQVVINSTGNVTIDDALLRRNTLAIGSGNATPGISATGGVTINQATSVAMANGTANAPSIWNTIGTVNIDVSKGPGGAIVLGGNSIISTSSAANSSGARTPGNITITGSGLTQLNGQLFGVSASPLAGIASGTILVNKTANGSTIDVGSAGRVGDPNAVPPGVPVFGAIVSPSGGGLTQSPAYNVNPQLGTAKIVGPPIIILSSASAITVTPPPPLAPTQSAMTKGDLVAPPAAPVYTRPFDDAQHGTVLITDLLGAGGTRRVAQPLLVGTGAANAPVGPALHNFSATPAGGVAPQFIAISEVARTGIAGGPSDLAAPAGTPAAPILPAANTTVIVNNQAAVTVNR